MKLLFLIVKTLISYFLHGILISFLLLVSYESSFPVQFATSGMKKHYSATSVLSQVLLFSALLISNLLKDSVHIVVIFILAGNSQCGRKKGSLKLLNCTNWENEAKVSWVAITTNSFTSWPTPQSLLFLCFKILLPLRGWFLFESYYLMVPLNFFYIWGS